MKGLHEELRSNLDILKHNKGVLENVKATMQEFGILRGETQKIFTGKTPLEKLDKRTLILLLDSLHRHSGMLRLSPLNFYSDKEIKQAKNQEISVATEAYTYPIIIHNALLKDEQTYAAFVSAKLLVNLYNSNLLAYNYKVSKQYKLVHKNGQLIQAIDINVREVKEIASEIVNNTYNMKPIVINVLTGSGVGRKEIEFANNTLTINESTVEIISGLHDISALASIIEENPKVELKVEIEIKHCNMEEIQEYFNQLNLKGGVN